MKQFRSLVFLALVGLGLGTSLAGCIWEDDGRGRGGYGREGEARRGGDWHEGHRDEGRRDWR